MTKAQIYFIITLLLSAGCLLVYYYIFNIYEVIYTVKPKELFADNTSQVKICAVPLNALGGKVPLRYSHTVFDIKEGRELVVIISENKNKGILVLRAKEKTGRVVVFLKAEHAVLPSSVEIFIYPNLANIEDKGIKKI